LKAIYSIARAFAEMELEILMVVAEISVALAGFSAIVANFSSNWTEATLGW
jgi:hypothetical protein